MSVTMESIEGSSYESSVEKFVAASPWLTEADMPQLRVLLGIARDLDSSPKARTSAMYSQFTLIQRTLAARAPGAVKPQGSLAQFLDNPDASMDDFLMPPQVVGTHG